MTASSPAPVPVAGEPREPGSGSPGAAGARVEGPDGATFERVADARVDRAADVRIIGVTKRFGDVTAVDDLSLDVRRGAFYSLLGPSGCGKTTTLRLIAGFEQPSAGEILIGGEPVAGVPPFRRDVNTVFQHYALFPHMNVRRNVGYGLRQRGIKGKEEARRVDEALDLVRLRGYDRRSTWELSGGQQQRVALARALVNHPTVLLLDEPLGALDLKLRREMQLELKSLQHQVGITFIYVTHDQEEAITMSDVVVVMHQGRIQQQGPPSELYERPVNRFVAGFLGQSNFLTGRLASFEEATGIAVVQADGGEKLRGRLTDRAVRPDPGSAVTVAVRPERIRVEPADEAASARTPSGDRAPSAPAASDGAGSERPAWERVMSDGAGGLARVPGRVREATYLGDQSEYRVETVLGTLVARRQNSEGSQMAGSFGPGDPVVVVWSEQANLVLAS